MAMANGAVGSDGLTLRGRTTPDPFSLTIDYVWSPQREPQLLRGGVARRNYRKVAMYELAYLNCGEAHRRPVGGLKITAVNCDP